MFFPESIERENQSWKKIFVRPLLDNLLPIPIKTHSRPAFPSLASARHSHNCQLNGIKLELEDFRV